MSQCPIGIDLGTTYSSVAVVKEGKVVVIPNDHGHRITPSKIGFDGSEHFVGDWVNDNSDELEPSNIICNIKRLMGRKFDDKAVQQGMKDALFKITKDDGGRASVSVNVDGADKRFSPEEISAMILRKMKETAETFLGEVVTEAVITVPAYFNNLQRQSTIDAGKIAGLKVLQVLTEPTAAAIAFGETWESAKAKEKTILVYDLGGGTFDVSIVSIESGQYRVRSTSGDMLLGGEDFNREIVNYITDQNQSKNICDDPKATLQLIEACEKAKILLTNNEVTTIRKPIKFELSRARFEALCDKYFKSTLEQIQKALSDAHLHKNEIDEIVLVGGSTRIPAVKNMLTKFFDGKKLNCSIHPDEAIAYGAAVCAANFHKNSKTLKLQDVTPLSLGIQMTGDIFSVIVKRNTLIPTTKKANYITSEDDVTTFFISIYQGEREIATENMLLDRLSFGPVPPRPKGEVKFDVTFSLDINGVLRVTAEQTTHGNIKEELTVKYSQGRLSKDRIQKMLADAEKYKEDDRKRKMAALERIRLENLKI